MNNKELILGIYKKLGMQLGKYPSIVDMKRIGVTEKTIYKNFANMTELKKAVGQIPGVKALNPDLEEIYKALGVKNVK